MSARCGFSRFRNEETQQQNPEWGCEQWAPGAVTPGPWVASTLCRKVLQTGRCNQPAASQVTARIILTICGKGHLKTTQLLISLHGDRWFLDLSWWPHCEVYKCWITILYTWNQYNIVYQRYLKKKTTTTTHLFSLNSCRKFKAFCCKKHPARPEFHVPDFFTPKCCYGFPGVVVQPGGQRGESLNVSWEDSSVGPKTDF